MTEEQYVQTKLRRFIRGCKERNRPYTFRTLRDLQEQWKFDYQIEYGCQK